MLMSDKNEVQYTTYGQQIASESKTAVCCSLDNILPRFMQCFVSPKYNGRCECQMIFFHQTNVALSVFAWMGLLCAIWSCVVLSYLICTNSVWQRTMSTLLVVRAVYGEFA